MLSVLSNHAEFYTSMYKVERKKQRNQNCPCYLFGVFSYRISNDAGFWGIEMVIPSNSS